MVIRPTPKEKGDFQQRKTTADSNKVKADLKT